MPVTITELNQKYNAEDKQWDFKLFWGWLRKKRFDDITINATLKQILADYSLDTLPEKHHDFDRAVVAVATSIKDKCDEILTNALETSVIEGFAKYEAEWNALSKTKKLWEVIRGRA